MDNTAIIKTFADDHSPEDNMRTDNNVSTQPLAEAETYHSTSNLSDPSACGTRQQRGSIIDARLVITALQSFRFFDMPPEVRLMIYELIIGANQRIYIDSVSSCNYWPSDSATLPACGIAMNTMLNHGRYARYELCPIEDRSTTVSYDLQTCKQDFTLKNPTPNNKSTVDPNKYSARRRLDLRLLWTCRQMYDEARPVLYRSNTFVFLGFSTLAAYFGLIALDQEHVRRSTEPHRLRAIKSMAKVEIRGSFGSKRSMSLLTVSRLIRMGFGCFTSLVSLELSLETFTTNDERRNWKIDDSMFSKPSTLRKLVLDMRISECSLGRYFYRTKEGERDTAEELLHRILKQEEFSDTIESFWRNEKTANLTEALT